LAIELAAVRAGTYSVREVAANLENRLAFLTQGHRTAPSRHQSLRATLDWSYETLLEEEQVALCRLAVFPGEFDAQSASALLADAMTDSTDPVDLVMDLVSKSFVTTT